MAVKELKFEGPPQFDFYANLIACKAQGTLYYVQHREAESILFSVLMEMTPPNKRKRFAEIYDKIKDECKSMDELKSQYIKNFLPVIMKEILIKFGMKTLIPIGDKITGQELLPGDLAKALEIRRLKDYLDSNPEFRSEYVKKLKDLGLDVFWDEIGEKMEEQLTEKIQLESPQELSSSEEEKERIQLKSFEEQKEIEIKQENIPQVLENKIYAKGDDLDEFKDEQDDAMEEYKKYVGQDNPFARSTWYWGDMFQDENELTDEEKKDILSKFPKKPKKNATGEEIKKFEDEMETLKQISAKIKQANKILNKYGSKSVQERSLKEFYEIIFEIADLNTNQDGEKKYIFYGLDKQIAGNKFKISTKQIKRLADYLSKKADIWVKD